MIIFWILAVLLVSSAAAVVVMRSTLNSALALTFNLLVMAAAFAGLHAHFLAVVQVIIYAGAIMVLILFAVMLLNVKAERHKRHENYLLVLAMVLAVCFCGALAPLVRAGFGQPAPETAAVSGSLAAVAKLLFSDYVLLSQVSGLLIIAALAGAVMLARERRKE